MSVLAFEMGDLFTVRIIKHLTTNPFNKWANSYEFKAYSSSSEALLTSLLQSVVRFEVAIHHNVVQFDHMVISTWAPDSVPYDPESFVSVPLVQVGNVGPGSDLLGLNQCASIARVPTSGRFGHIFYRGALTEADVEAPAGRTTFGDLSGYQDTINDALTSSGLDDLLGNPPAEDIGMVMVNKDGTQVRPVLTLTVKGVSTVPLDHAWFNRGITVHLP